MSKHTPGPWFVMSNDDRQEYCVGAEDMDTGGPIVCDLTISSEDVSEIKANASLIAAAPELLSACHRAMHVLHEYNIERDVLDALHLAIAKAEEGA